MRNAKKGYRSGMIKIALEDLRNGMPTYVFDRQAVDEIATVLNSDEILAVRKTSDGTYELKMATFEEVWEGFRNWCVKNQSKLHDGTAILKFRKEVKVLW